MLDVSHCLRSSQAEMLDYRVPLLCRKAPTDQGFGMQTFRAPICFLPKKVMKEIESCCRVFLWTGQTNPSRKALIAWSQVCLPKVSGGWNVISMTLWNKAAIAKHLWSLANKAD